MAESANDPKKIFCNFCKKFRSQAGELRCEHRMCAGCYLDHSNKLDKCYLCILAAAQAKRDAMKIVNCFEDIESETVPNEENFFCTNTNCEFIGKKLEWVNHKPICDLRQGSVAQKDMSTYPDPSVFADKNTLKSRKFIEILKAVFESAVLETKRPLTTDDVRCLAFEAWQYTEESFEDESTQVGTKAAQAKESIVCTKPVMSGLVNQADEIPQSVSEREIPQTVAPKYSVEISDFVETNHSSPEVESFDSNRSTSELLATESNCAFVASEGLDWDLCAEGKPLSSTVEDSSDSDLEPEDFEERFEMIGEVDASPDPLEQVNQGRPARQEGNEGSRAEISLLNPNRESKYFRVLFAVLMLPILSLQLFRVESISRDVPKIKHPGDTDGYITWNMDNVSDIVARAQFNKRDMRLSQFVSLRNYEVRLGVGSTFAVDDNAVILWITAVVMKDDERAWPLEEMQLRLEHDDPTLVQTYDFKTDQKGQWRDMKRTDKKTLLFRQMQIETTKRMKYMRFTNYLTYDDAVAKGYVKDDTVSVGFKLMPWGSSA